MEKGERPRDDLIIGLRKRAEIPTGGKRRKGAKSGARPYSAPITEEGGGYGGCDENASGKG
jgi:hypothetical protein